MWDRACYREQIALATISKLKTDNATIVAEFKSQITNLKSELAHMKHLVFGCKSEKTSRSQKNAENTTRKPSSRNKGQQPGAPGHGRRCHNNLPIISESINLPLNEQCCSTCKLPFKPFIGTDHCDVVEVEVKAYVRRYHRQRYQKTCKCVETPRVIVAPSAPRIINKGKLGISVWVQVLLNKYAFGIPINRQLESFKSQGLNLSQGTISGGQQAMLPFFEPVVDAIRLHVSESNQWHADETRWIVWTHGKKGSDKHWLWVFLCDEAAYYDIANSRSANVPASVIGGKEGTLICDRYSAYKKLANDTSTIVLAFCWAHIRRDFIDAQRGNSELEKWSATWVKRIGRLYSLNKTRMKVIDDNEAFAHQQLKLEKHINIMVKRRDAELQRQHLNEKAKKVLTSLKNHWRGLTRFVYNPVITMDNNAAERALRNPITGRKNYYGAGSEWSIKLSAWLFSVFMTLKMWKINPRIWLADYLNACAVNNRKSPENLSLWLPWLMSENRLSEMQNHDPPVSGDK